MPAKGFYLALDTATEACSAALWLDGRVLERYEVAERSHTQRLLPMLHELLADAGRGIDTLDGLACGAGPGSFAGVRIAVGVAKGLALARELPVVSVSSLAMIAQGECREHGPGDVAAAIDARMGEVYFGAYRPGADGRVQPVLPDRVCAPTQAPPLPPGRWRAAGTGWGAHAGALAAAVGATLERTDGARLPRAIDALTLALPEFAAGRAGTGAALAPFYLRDRVALTLAEQAGGAQPLGRGGVKDP